MKWDKITHSEAIQNLVLCVSRSEDSVYSVIKITPNEFGPTH